MRRLLVLILAVGLSVIGTLSFSAYDSRSVGTVLSADRSGLYRVAYNGKHADVSRYAPDTVNATVDLSYNITVVKAFGGNIVFCCDDSANDQMIVYVYSLDANTLDSFAIYGGGVFNNADFCCDADSFYLVESRSTDILRQYSLDGNLVMTYTLDGEITQVFPSYDGEVYAVSRRRLFSINNRSVTALLGTVDPPLLPVDRDHIASAYGDIYDISGGSAEYCFTADSDNSVRLACIIGNVLYYPSGTTIYGYDMNSVDKRCYYHISFRAEALYAVGDNIIALNAAGSFNRINKDAFTSLAATVPENVDATINNNTYDDNTVHSVISSEIYDIDFDRGQISRIPAPTTIAAFKRNISYDGYTLRLLRDDTLKTSGNVGTAWLAVFSGDGDDRSFELSVIGDLTCEGNCNSRDVNLLMDRFIGTADFNGVYLLSADMNDDGSIDAVDLALMKRSCSL